MQGHVGSKTLLQQNPSVLDWRCQPTQTDSHSGCKTCCCCCCTM